MKIVTNLFLMALLVTALSAQPNCNVFLWEGDTLQYEACNLSYKFSDYYQFDLRGLAILDSCLSICPYFADAHYEYGVVYLKAGNFIGWNKYINSAVKYDALNYLGLRASCRGKFFADYQGAINDIDSLDALIDYDIGFTHDGAYHLDAYKALCYKAMGDDETAIKLFEKHLVKNKNYTCLFDYIHLGVAYLNEHNYSKALECFGQQELVNNLAENNYYAAVCHLQLGNIPQYKLYYEKATKMLSSDLKMADPYHVMEDEIFLGNLEELNTKFINR